MRNGQQNETTGGYRGIMEKSMENAVLYRVF